MTTTRTPAGLVACLCVAGPALESGPPPVPPSFTINPAAVPVGTELSFGTLYSASRIETVVELMDTNSYTCSARPEPFPPPYGYGVVVVYEGPGGPAVNHVEPAGS